MRIKAKSFGSSKNESGVVGTNTRNDWLRVCSEQIIMITTIEAMFLHNTKILPDVLLSFAIITAS